MTIPVIWYSDNPDAISRSYWDQSMLEDIFAREMWRIPGGVEFVHSRYESWSDDANEWPDVPGAVVVVPLRHHTDREHMNRLNDRLATLDWLVFVGTGDEEATFDFSALTHPNRRVWAMHAKPGSPVDVPLGSGYSPGFPALVASNPAPVEGRLDLFLCAQETHSRRRECFDACRAAVPEARRLLVPTGEFLADGSEAKGGMAREEYAWALADCKVAPAPSGPESVDSFRLYEALEAGTFPLADGVSPKGAQGGWWRWVFGDDVPFLVMDDWKPLPAVMETVLRGWPANAARVSAWWQASKRALAYRMEADVRALEQTSPVYGSPDDLITVVIPTCPIPSHPDTTMIETVVESIRAQLPTAEIIIACDGVRPTMVHRQADYDLFLHRLTRLCQRWSNVLPVILDDWSHQIGGTRAAVDLVTTPLMLFVEHDTPLTGEIDWPGLCAVVGDGVVNMVRLHHETAIGEPHQHMVLDVPEVYYGKSDSRPGGVPLVRTVQWSQRPHLARTQWYRDEVLAQFPPDACTYLEWVMHGLVTHGIEHGKEKTWDRWRVAIYYPPGGNIQRSTHLDGRRTGGVDQELSTEDSVEAFKKMQAR